MTLGRLWSLWGDCGDSGKIVVMLGELLKALVNLWKAWVACNGSGLPVEGLVGL